MNRIRSYAPILLAFLFLALSSSSVFAQSPTPPAPTASGPVVKATGKIMNVNQPTKAPGELDVMLHVWDQGGDEISMLHGKSKADGTFEIDQVPVTAGFNYDAMVTYENATYVSDPVQAADSKSNLSFEVPIHESSPDLSKVTIDQMHVLLNFADDGMEVREVIIASNEGDRTVKDAVVLENGEKAAIKYTLPEKFEYLIFEPSDDKRFVKLADGFADKAPITPGEQISQTILSFLVPYNDGPYFSFTPPVAVKNLNFLLSEDSGIKISGEGITPGRLMTTQQGQKIQIYTVSNLAAGKPIQLSFSGKPKSIESSSTFPVSPVDMPWLIGGSVLGLAFLVGGVVWWRRSSSVSEDEPNTDEVVFVKKSPWQAQLEEIAFLDLAFENGEMSSEEYQSQRQELIRQARELMDEGDRPEENDPEEESGSES